MALSFPNNPSVNQTSIQNGRVYKWSGYAWEFLSVSPSEDARWSLFAPPAPTNVLVSAGNAQATVTWTAPSATYIPPIIDYVVQYSSNSGSTWTTFSDGTSSSTGATVTGLTNGTSYVFRVAGVNGVGTGPYTSASASVTPVDGDPDWSSVKLLLPCDGANNSTTFTDASGTVSVTTNGSARVSTSQKKWGTGSLLLDGGYLSMSSSAIQLSAATWTVELWLRPTATGYQSIVLQPNAFHCHLFGSGNAINVNNAVVGAFDGGSVSVNEWHHLALVRDAGVISIYLDGTRIGTTTFSPGSNGYTQIGSDGQSGPFSGNIDDVRFSMGIARYSGASLTVPTAAFKTA